MFQYTSFRGYFSGWTLSSTATTLVVQPGVALDSTNSQIIELTAAHTTLLSAFAPGNNVGGLTFGALNASTTYYIYAIMRADLSGTPDICFDLSATAPRLPPNYQYFTKIGQFATSSTNTVASTTPINGGNILQPANNLSDIPNPAVALQNLSGSTISGLGTMAAQNSNNVSITGGTISGVNVIADTISGATILASTLTGNTLSGTTTNVGTISGGSVVGVTSLQEYSADASAVIGPSLDIFRDSASPAAADVIGSIDLTGRDSAGAKVIYGRIVGNIDSAATVSATGHIDFVTLSANATISGVQLYGVAPFVRLFDNQLSPIIGGQSSTTTGIGILSGVMRLTAGGTAGFDVNPTSSMFQNATSSKGSFLKTGDAGADIVVVGPDRTVSNTGLGGTGGTLTAIFGGKACITVSATNALGLQFNNYGTGAITADSSGRLTSVSDERLKYVLRSFPGIVRNIKPIIYKWREESGMETNDEYAGFSAQNVQSICPEAVSTNKDGFLSLNDRGLLAAAINSINDLDRRLTALEERLSASDPPP